MSLSKENKRLIIQIGIAAITIIVLLVIDIVTKLSVLNYFNRVEGANIVIIDNFFWIHLVYNRGALGGIFGGIDNSMIILSIFSVIGTIIGFFFLVWKFKKLPILYRIALYIFIPGCMGNLIDRVGLYNTPGVVDFLRFRLFGFYDFPVFNFADMCLTVSIIMFIIAIIFTKDKDKETLSEEVNNKIEEAKILESNTSSKSESGDESEEGA